ncbi:f-box only protein [Anaeramoeba flamelloides]|uniref:F-box only protein n=1 Tax=Anaeramoeba flamelloides TaxID=1746091 RepID=A0AAV7Z377_9EUKA|nr:f-box only protein [Anaeramoeba flamelloides]KAJ6241745.1 f-box only protein [Anaeramoeba flamelloides]
MTSSSFIQFDYLKFRSLLNFNLNRKNELPQIDSSSSSPYEFSFDSNNYFQEASTNYFSLLPDEILFQIFSNLDKPVYLGLCSCVNRQFNRVADDWILWKKFLQQNCKLLDFEEIQVNYFRPTQLVGRMGLVEYFSEEPKQQPLLLQKQQKIKEQQEHSTSSTKIKKLAKKIRKNPKKLFVEQIEKVMNAKSESFSQREYFKKKETAKRIQNIVNSPLSIFIVYSIIFPFTILSLGLKLDKIMFANLPWLILLTPFFLALLYSIFAISIPLLFSISKQIFLKAFVECLSLFFLFILSLALKADQILITKYSYSTIPLILLLAVSIYSSLKYYKEKYGHLNNSNSLKQYIIMEGSRYFYSNLYLAISLISFLLYALKSDFNLKISWIIIFFPLFLGEFISLVGLFISFVSLFVCFPIFGGSVLVCLIAFFFGIPFTFTFFLTYLNVSKLKLLSWRFILLPALIPSFLFFIFLGCVLYRRIKKKKYNNFVNI